MTSRPFGADTLIIPFEIVGGRTAPDDAEGMSRLEPPEELYRNGVIRTARDDVDAKVFDKSRFRIGADESSVRE